MTNITYLQEDPPSYHNQNVTCDENQNLTDTESYDENQIDNKSLPELPPYDNTEANLFLEQSIFKKKMCSKKPQNCLFFIIFIIVNTIAFSFFVKTPLIDTCNTFNSTCYHKYICDEFHNCYYQNICDDCGGINFSIFIFIILNFIITTIIYFIIIKILDYTLCSL